MKVVLGLDAGGTKTRAVICDETGQVLADVTAGAGNMDGVGQAVAQRSLREAVEAARTAAGNLTIDAAFAGLAGVVTEQDREQATAMLAPALPGARLMIDHDCRVALAGGLSGRPGIVLIAGTGASCFGRNADGRAWLASGWGATFGDEGSGYWIAVEGVRAALRCHDGRGAKTSLGAVLWPALGISHPNDVLRYARSGAWKRPQIAALAPLVIEAASHGDQVAWSIVNQAADELSRAVDAVRRAVGLTGSFETVLAGGLWRADVMVQAVGHKLSQVAPQGRIVDAELPPARGAALLALTELLGRGAPQLSVSELAAQLRQGN